MLGFGAANAPTIKNSAKLVIDKQSFIMIEFASFEIILFHTRQNLSASHLTRWLTISQLNGPKQDQKYFLGCGWGVSGS